MQTLRCRTVPGHEIAGEVVAIGKNIRRFSEGDRVTLPFVGGCGRCAQCASGNHQICDYQFQPGFTHWGSYAEYVAIKYADINVVPLPDEIDYVTAASLGCRFATSFRAVVAQGKVAADQWVAVHGCGGVGLAAVMIAKAFGARVIAVDIDDDALKLAKAVGAERCIDATTVASVVESIKDVSEGGAHLSIEALGSQQTCQDSIACLRKRGRHVQVGLLAGDDYRPSLPMELVIANELELIGSHGMQAAEYDRMLTMIRDGRLEPKNLVRQTVDLERAAATLGEPGALHVAGRDSHRSFLTGINESATLHDYRCFRRRRGLAVGDCNLV